LPRLEINRVAMPFPTIQRRLDRLSRLETSYLPRELDFRGHSHLLEASLLPPEPEDGKSGQARQSQKDPCTP
jgi:hypothetical protein